jgi:hypothetical protein
MANVRIENAVVKGVSSPETINRIATERKLNPQEVFVRLTFETNGVEYVASNKLRFLGEKDYTELLKLKETNGTVDITVDTENEFFYINHNVAVADLFKEKLPEKARENKLDALISIIK